MKRQVSVGQAVVDLVAQYEVAAAFGIPGVHTLELFRGLAEAPIRQVTPRHEQGASFMADGYAAVTGRPALCVLITGPGVTNAATGIAQAHHDSRPMLILSSAVASEELDCPRGSLHDLPGQESILAGVTGINAMVRDPELLPELLRDAFDLFQTKRPRPVHISIPIDVLVSPAPRLERLSARTHLPRIPPDSAALSAAAALLSDAERPVMILGGGAVDAGAAATAVAERIGAPIVLTGNAKGIVPAEHPLVVAGALATAPVLGALAEADVVLAVGTELSSVEQASSGREMAIPGRLIRIDIDPGRLQGGFPAEIGIAGTALAALEGIAAGFRPRDGASGGVVRAEALREEVRLLDREADRRPWVEAIAANVPDEAIVAVDSNQLAYAMHDTMDWSRPRSWLAPYGFGTLGPALPMAIGAKVASPERVALAVAGDGGALFTIGELAAAVQEYLPLTYVIWNSSSYQEIREAMDTSGYPPLGTTLSRVDFAALGRALGCDGITVTSADELGTALGERLGAQRTTVIEAVVTA